MKRIICRILARLFAKDVSVWTADGDAVEGYCVWYHCGRHWVTWLQVWYEFDMVELVRLPREKVTEVRRRW